MFKESVSILTLIVFVLSTLMPAQLFAGGDICYEGRICRDLGILKGETGIVDGDYLRTRPSRLQSAIMFLRLKGLEQEALYYTGGNNFKDSGTVKWEEGRNVLSYLKDNPNLGWIGDGANFMPYNLIDSREYYKVLLESLGYKQKIDGAGDFSWDSALEFAKGKGLYKEAYTKAFTVESLAVATVEALKAKMKNSGKSLIEHLVDIGEIDKREAVSAGLISDALEAEIKTVKAISNSKVEIVFEEPVDGSDAAEESLYEIKALEIKGVTIKNETSVIVDTSAMKENTNYTLVFNYKSYSFEGLKKDNNGPKLVGVECKDTDLTELSFDRVLDNETAQNADTYSISGVEIESAGLDCTNTKVRLVTDGIKAGHSYELKIHNIKNGDGVKTKLITKRFTGRRDTTPPKLEKLTVLNNIRLLLEFSDNNGLDKSTAQDENNYSINQSGRALEIEAAVVKDRDNDGLWDSVELITEGQESGKTYILLIKNITDGSVLGNKISRDIKREFRGKAIDRAAPTIARNPQAVTNTMVEIEFKDANALDIQSACDISNYDIDGGLEILDIRIKNPDDLYSVKGRTVLLITDEMEKSESYTIAISGIADEFGNEMGASGGSGNKKYKFRGPAADRTPPYVTSAACLDGKTIEIIFDNALDAGSAEKTINYRVDGLALVTKAVLQEDDRTVRLTVSSLSSGKSHTLLLNNIRDLSGNALSDVKVSVYYKGSSSNDPPEIAYIEAINEEEIWIHFEREVYGKNAKLNTSGLSFEQVGNILEDGTVVVMKASKPMKNEEYEVIKLTGIWDLRDNSYETGRNLNFYGNDARNDPPEVEYWEQTDVRRFRVIFTEPVLLKGNGVSGIRNPGVIDLDWKAVLNPDDGETTEAYSTVEYVASRNIPADKEFKFNFTAMVSDYMGFGVHDEGDYNGDSGSTILESFMEDDERPYIEYAEAITRNKVQILFSEAMGLPGSYKITYYDERNKSRTIAVNMVEIDTKDKDRVNIFTNDQMSDEYIYTLKPQSAAADIAGNKLDIRDLEIDFEGSNIMSSDYIQSVEILDAYTLRVSKSSRIYKVNSLYELGDDSEKTVEDIRDGDSIRISESTHILAAKKPLLRNIRYKIVVDGMEYKFYGGVTEGGLELKIPELTVAYDNMDPERHWIEMNGKTLDFDRAKGCFAVDRNSIRNGDTVYIYVRTKSRDSILYGIRSKIQGMTEASSSKEIMHYTFPGNDFESKVKIDNEAGIINVAVPYGTDLSAIKALFKCSPGASVMIANKVQKSGETENDFSEDVIYTVVAENGSKTRYTVKVNIEASKYKKEIKEFSFRGLNPAVTGEINLDSNEIFLMVPFGTDLKTLVPFISLSENSATEPKSGEIRDFSSPAEYKVVAPDGSSRLYKITVMTAINNEKQIKEFGFAIPKVPGIIDEPAKNINITVPFGTDITRLAAVFKSSGKSTVMVAGIAQESGVTVNDFTEKVVYLVMAEDGSAQNYSVIVTIDCDESKPQQRIRVKPIHHFKNY